MALFWNLLHLLDSHTRLAHLLAAAKSIFLANGQGLLLLAAFSSFMLLCEADLGAVCEEEL